MLYFKLASCLEATCAYACIFVFLLALLEAHEMATHAPKSANIFLVMHDIATDDQINR